MLIELDNPEVHIDTLAAGITINLENAALRLCFGSLAIIMGHAWLFIEVHSIDFPSCQVTAADTTFRILWLLMHSPTFMTPRDTIPPPHTKAAFKH